MKDDKLYLIHIMESIERIESYTAGVSFSSQRLSQDFKSTHHGVEWYKISGLRNILVHDYLGIDLENVWAILEKELP